MPIALVIDDNQQTADSICEMISFFRIKAFPVYGPRGAFLALQQFIPDVIFMDLNMPGVDGFEVMAYLQRHPKLSRIPIVVVTSDDQLETAQKASELGAVQTVIKPITTETIESILRKIRLVV